MRVAQVLCADSYAGAEAVATRLALALDGMVEASVLYVVRELRAGQGPCDQLAEQVSATGVNRRIFDVHSRFSASLVREVSIALLRDGINVLHSHAYKIAAQLPLIRRGTPVAGTAFTIHGFDQPHWRGRVFLWTANAVGAFFADRVVCVSRALTRHYARYPALASRVRHVPNAAPSVTDGSWNELVERRRVASKSIYHEHQLEREVPWLLAVGRLVPVKNLSMLLDALAVLRRDHSLDVGLIVLGDGPLRSQLEAQSRRSRLRVRFLGTVPDVTPYYAACDALVLSSNSEASPMVVLEALSNGLPVIARAVGDVGHMLRDGHDGVLVNAPDPMELAHAIQRVIAEPDFRASLGRHAWDHARLDLSPERWARSHVAIYEEILRAR